MCVDYIDVHIHARTKDRPARGGSCITQVEEPSRKEAPPSVSLSRRGREWYMRTSSGTPKKHHKTFGCWSWLPSSTESFLGWKWAYQNIGNLPNKPSRTEEAPIRERCHLLKWTGWPNTWGSSLAYKNKSPQFCAGTVTTPTPNIAIIGMDCSNHVGSCFITTRATEQKYSSRKGATSNCTHSTKRIK